MTPEIELFMTGFHRVGRLEFPSPKERSARRSLCGLALTLPTEIMLEKSADRPLLPSLSRVHAIVRLGDIEVGVATDSSFYDAPSKRIDGGLVPRISAAEIRALERIRNGGAVRFRFEVGAHVPTSAVPCARVGREQNS